MDKRVNDKLVRSPGETGGGLYSQKHVHSRNGSDDAKEETQERLERGSRKRSSSAGSEKMERVGEGYCSTGQSPQWAVMPLEEEEEEGEGGGGERGGGGEKEKKKKKRRRKGDIRSRRRRGEEQEQEQKGEEEKGEG